MSEKIKVNVGTGGLYFLAQLCTSVIGHEIHGSIFWAIMDFLFLPFAWIKWALMQQVNMSIIKEAFSWFFV